MTSSPRPLTTWLDKTDHSRDAVGMTYVYPVVSRRSRGVSIGINLNPNNACNWHCVYCQVPNLTRGEGPPIDLELLGRELRTLLDDIEAGHFLEQRVPPEHRVVRDFAFSGNGEPTSSPQFLEALEVVARIRSERAALSGLPIVLITNGSLADREPVLDAISHLGRLGGRVWFKLDRATDSGLVATNGARTHVARHLTRLEKVAARCPTWVQSCWFRRAGEDPTPQEVEAYRTAMAELVARCVPIRGVQLYTLARTPQQPEAVGLEPVSAEWLTRLAGELSSLGLDASINL